MFAVDVLGDTAKEGQSQGCSDVFMAVDGWCNGFDDALANSLISGEGSNLTLVFFGETEGGELVFFFVDVVRFEDGGKDGKAIFDIERSVKVVAVDASDLL